MLDAGTLRAPSVVFGEGRRPEASTRVAVAEFEGPLALLLALIEARELDVLTVPLGALADAYLDALATLDVDRLGNVSSFVAVASQLILIKSRAMLPRQAPAGPAGLADEAPDPEAELRARLLLYRAYRDAGASLAAEALRRVGLFRREPGTAHAAAMAGARPADVPPLSPMLLVRALDGVARIAPPPELPPETVPRTITLTERAAIIRDALRDAPIGRPPGPAPRRPRSGGRRRHVPGDARADEAARDRGRAGRAMGADRRALDDGRGTGRGRRRGEIRRTARRDAWSPSRDRRRGARARSGRQRHAPGCRAAAPEPIELTEAVLEALLFVAERPLSRREIAALAGTDRETVDARLGDLEVSLRLRGIRLVLSGDRVELVTAPEAGALIARYVGADAVRLSPASLETLAIVAYRQPVTRSAIERIRGVDSDYTVRTLLHRRLIVELGRSDAPGRPFLYGTGFDFLERFGLTTLDELPPLELEVAARLAEEGGEELPADSSEVPSQPDAPDEPGEPDPKP